MTNLTDEGDYVLDLISPMILWYRTLITDPRVMTIDMLTPKSTCTGTHSLPINLFAHIYFHGPLIQDMTSKHINSWYFGMV